MSDGLYHPPDHRKLRKPLEGQNALDEFGIKKTRREYHKEVDE